MIRTDEDAFICDMAETYHIYDWRSLPVSLASTLAAGLRENSRIKMMMAEAKVDPELLLMARVVDNTALLLWLIGGGSKSGIDKPSSVAMRILEAAEPKETAAPKKSEYRGFSSGEDFMEWRASMLTE